LISVILDKASGVSEEFHPAHTLNFWLIQVTAGDDIGGIFFAYLLFGLSKQLHRTADCAEFLAFL